MAPGTVGAPSAEHTRCWNLFQSLAEGRIKEGNLVAGERLWELVKSSDPSNRLIIRSSSDPDDCVECSLDSGILTCQPGSAIECGALVFRLAGDTVGMVLADEHRFTLDQALTMMLDQLVSADRCDDEVEGAPGIAL
jgi:hypothetical protein